MYGRIFESMFEGSLVGSRPIVWAVWGYVIAKQRRDRVVGSQVRLNPTLLATIFGTTEKEVAGAVEFLCSPDEHSHSKKEGGRRLVRVGEFEYQVVNGAKYMAVRDEEDRRAQNRESQRTFRAKQSRPGRDGRHPKRTKAEQAEIREQANGMAAGADTDEFIPAVMEGKAAAPGEGGG
jgi:hypothetical protein